MGHSEKTRLAVNGASLNLDWQRGYRGDGKRFVVRADEELIAFAKPQIRGLRFPANWLDRLASFSQNLPLLQTI